jgi:hypothetical protein
MRRYPEIDGHLSDRRLAGLGSGDGMKVSRTSARLAVAAGVTVGALLLGSTPAWAVETTMKIGNIQLGHGGVINSGYKLYACDDRADGFGIRTEVTLNTGYTTYVGDGNGSKPGCGEKVTPGAAYAQQYRICWGETTCTAWARAY